MKTSVEEATNLLGQLRAWRASARGLIRRAGLLPDDTTETLEDQLQDIVLDQVVYAGTPEEAYRSVTVEDMAAVFSRLNNRAPRWIVVTELTALGISQATAYRQLRLDVNGPFRDHLREEGDFLVWTP